MTTALGEDGGRLVERADELAALDDALGAAVAGHGATLLVEGPPGIGKSELLVAAVERARAAGMLVLAARAGELEGSLPYAVVRQLFEPAGTAAGRAVRERLRSGAADQVRAVVDPCAELVAFESDPSAVLHGLYWLTADLAVRRPLALVVDDVHWCDPWSVGWLCHLARRIDGLPVALILGARPGEPGSDGALLDALRAVEGLRRVTPGPLSLTGVDALARAALGAGVEQAFSASCRAATGGNPFYVAELLRALRRDGIAGTAASADAIAGMTPSAVVDATLSRLRRISGDALAVAEAVALLEPHADLRWVADLTGLDGDAVACAADALLALGILRSVAPRRRDLRLDTSSALRCGVPTAAATPARRWTGRSTSRWRAAPTRSPSARVRSCGRWARGRGGSP